MIMKMFKNVPILILLILTQLILACNEEVSKPDPNIGDSFLPAIVFSADKTIISSGDTVTFTWSVINADECRATGDWSGLKNMVGSQMISSVTRDSSYTLTCDGPGGQSTLTISVSVINDTNLPTISFLSNTTTISSGDSITLNWSISDADTCSATGDWSGSKNMTGSQIISSVTQDSSYTLICDGPGGQSTVTVTVSVIVSSDVITGSVDSSYINRSKQNVIYIYKGDVTPDDYDGDAGDPYQTIQVAQSENACTWVYTSGNLLAGLYTLAFTSEAENDAPAVDDVLVFDKVLTVTKSDTGFTQNFAARRILQVGADKLYKTVLSAAVAANSGDVIEIDAGIYDDDIVVWRDNNLTLRGVGGRAHMRSTIPISYTPGNDQENGMGIWVTKANNIKVENIEFSGSKVPPEFGHNGAGIRAEGNDLSICNSYFHDNENGILGGSGEVFIEYSEFNHNGLGEYGRTHNMYISENVTRFTLKHSYSHHAYIGHNVKSRAQENYILYNRIMDEASGQSSYAIDLPNGGDSYIIGNLIQQGANTDNSTIVSYAAEGYRNDGRVNNLHMINNTLVNDYMSGKFVYVQSGANTAELVNNIFAGGGSVVSGTATQVTNLVSATPGLQNQFGYYYRLNFDSDAVNAGTSPGLSGNTDLAPYYQYVENSQREPRPNDGLIDIGAYEYE